MLARLGITSLFLFAGMEIDINEIKQYSKPLRKYLLKSFIIISISALSFIYLLKENVQVSMIIAIAILTPSAGFILSSLGGFNFSEDQKTWIKLKAISKEISAITVLFFALQINDPKALLISILVMGLMIYLLPKIFKFFLKTIAPYAPGTEVSFLVLIAFTTGVITNKLGTHYLVGAFITGVVAGQFKHFMDSEQSNSIFHMIEIFFGIFIPFYFFKAGMILTISMFNLNGLYIGLAFCAVFIPLRLFVVNWGVKYFIDNIHDPKKIIAISLMPNLIFGLVIVSILDTQFNTNPNILFGIIFYTLISSILPTLLFDKKEPGFYDLSSV